MDSTKPDPEMLNELELLLNMDSLEEESDWEALLTEDKDEPDETEEK